MFSVIIGQLSTVCCILNRRRRQTTDNSHDNYNSKAAPAGRGERKGDSRSSLYFQSYLYLETYTDQFVPMRRGILRLGESQLLDTLPTQSRQGLGSCPQLEEVLDQ